MFRANIYRPLDGRMVILQLCRWKFSHKETSRFYSIEIEFNLKQKQKIAFWATLWGLKGNVLTPFIARWKACGRLPIRHNWSLRHPPTTVGVRKLEWLSFGVVYKYPQCIIWFCHKACVWRTDGRTDRQTDGRAELRLPRPCYHSCIAWQKSWL